MVRFHCLLRVRDVGVIFYDQLNHCYTFCHFITQIIPRAFVKVFFFILFYDFFLSYVIATLENYSVTKDMKEGKRKSSSLDGKFVKFY